MKGSTPVVIPSVLPPLVIPSVVEESLRLAACALWAHFMRSLHALSLGRDDKGEKKGALGSAKNYEL